MFEQGEPAKDWSRGPVGYLRAAAAAIGPAFAHAEHHRCPQLTHTYCSTVSPVGTSMALSTRSGPSHVRHRRNSASIDQGYAESKPITVQI